MFFKLFLKAYKFFSVLLDIWFKMFFLQLIPVMLLFFLLLQIQLNIFTAYWRCWDNRNVQKYSGQKFLFSNILHPIQKRLSISFLFYFDAAAVPKKEEQKLVEKLARRNFSLIGKGNFVYQKKEIIFIPWNIQRKKNHTVFYQYL